MAADSGQTPVDFDGDTGEGSLGKPALVIARQSSNVNAVATQLTKDAASSSEEEDIEEASDHEVDKEEDVSSLQDAKEDKQQEDSVQNVKEETEDEDKEVVYDDDDGETPGPTLEISPGEVDVGELPEIELEPSEVVEEESNVVPDSSLKPILETERLTISVSSEHESDNDDAKSRSDRADTISVKSSSSSHAEFESVTKSFESVTKSFDTSVAVSETTGTAQFLHTVTESENDTPLKDKTESSAIQTNEEQMQPVTEVKNEELESCQAELQELRAKLEQYENVRDADRFQSELEAKKQENEDLRRKLEEREGALEEAKTQQGELGDQIKTLETRREEEAALRQGEVSQLEASVAALKLELEQKALLAREEDSALEKNGLSAGNRTAQSRTSLRPSSAVQPVQKKPSKVCVLL